METDKDHIHLLVSYPPNISVTSIVRKPKQKSTIYIWRRYSLILSKHFWKEHTFWSDGYFACSIGDTNPETIRKYIEIKDSSWRHSSQKLKTSGFSAVDYIKPVPYVNVPWQDTFYH